jgi:hypothetical protein
MEEPTQQPNDNSTRQADSIGSEELDVAILAAVQRATDAHSAESPADASDEQSFADDDFALAGDIVEDFDDDFALLGTIVYPSDDENEDLFLQAPISPPIEEVKLPQPHADDAVLGGQNPVLVSGAVLGGIEGVKSRLASAVIEHKIAALTEALKYGKAGLDLVIQALKNESKPVAQAAYFLLQDSLEPMAQQALQEHNPYRSADNSRA